MVEGIAAAIMEQGRRLQNGIAQQTTTAATTVTNVPGLTMYGTMLQTLTKGIITTTALTSDTNIITRACSHYRSTPIFWLILRHSSLKILEIRQVFLRIFA